MDFLQTAKQMALEAGAMMKQSTGKGFAVQEKGTVYDVVTEVDQGVERLIRQIISETYPHHRILGEEQMSEQGLSLQQILETEIADDYLWIVDPIDGTVNFVNRIPGYTVSIALAYQGELLVGVIYDPLRDEMFWAEKGKGAFLNGVPIRCSSTQTLAESVVATGFPADLHGARRAVVNSLGQVALTCRSVRVLGSAALHLAYVASGRLCAFWEYGMHTWDIAAGVLIVCEAGGKVSDVQGEAYSLTTENVLCSNGHIHSLMLPLLK